LQEHQKKDILPKHSLFQPKYCQLGKFLSINWTLYKKANQLLDRHSTKTPKSQ